MIGMGVGVLYGDDRQSSVPLKTTWEEQADGGNTTKTCDVFKPGETAPTSGIYDVVHDKLDGDDHFQPHQVTAVYGERFPLCRLVGIRLTQVAPTGCGLAFGVGWTIRS